MPKIYKGIFEYIRTVEMARLGIQIIFDGHFIQIFKYLCSSLLLAVQWYDLLYIALHPTLCHIVLHPTLFYIALQLIVQCARLTAISAMLDNWLQPTACYITQHPLVYYIAIHSYALQECDQLSLHWSDVSTQYIERSTVE